MNNHTNDTAYFCNSGRTGTIVAKDNLPAPVSAQGRT